MAYTQTVSREFFLAWFDLDLTEKGNCMPGMLCHCVMSIMWNCEKFSVLSLLAEQCSLCIKA
jgi:hypothetical protein